MSKVIYGNGEMTLGEYPLAKEALAVDIVQLPGGIEVVWDSGDIVTIEGLSANVTKPTVSRQSFNYLASYSYRDRFGGVQNRSFTVRSWSKPTAFLHGCNGTAYFMISSECSAHARSTEVACGLNLERSFNILCPSNNGFQIDNVLLATAPYFSSVISANISNATGVFSTCNTVRKTVVTSNTGAISERWGDRSPSLTILPGGCVLSITYADNSSEQIPLPACYEWAQIVTDCPQWVCDTLDNLINLVGNF